MSSQQVHYLYECLKKNVPYHPAQINQFTQLQEPDLPEFLFHFDDEDDPVPPFVITNPYEAIITHDPSRGCVHISSDMLQSFQLQEETPDPTQGTNILYLPGSGKTHLDQIHLWSIMSDRPSYTSHPQPSVYLEAVAWTSV